MKNWKNLHILRILTGLVVLFLVGCPNNLLDKIEEEVEIVVTPPSVVSIYPESGAVNVPIDMDNILITFTKQIDSSSVNNSTFITKDSAGNIVSGTYSVSNDTIAFNPSSNLSYDTTFTITAKSAILDIDGNQMINEFSWTFITEDAPAGIKPLIQSFDINNGNSATNSADVNLSIYATDHDGGTSGLNFRYKLEDASEWGEWLPLDEGAGSTSEVLGITSGITETFIYETEVRDASGIFSDVSSVQIVYETTAPFVLDVSWDDDTVFPYNGSIIKITFDEEMKASSFSETDFTIYTVAAIPVQVPGMISLSSGTSSHNNVTELVGLTLAPNTQYKVTLTNVVEDIAGNALGGDINYWYFYTGDSADTTAPNGTVELADIGFVIETLPNGALATNNYHINLDLSDISDDYNTVWGMKFWGDSDGSEAAFEGGATWVSFATTRDWYVSNTPGTKFILYKFVDSAGNESENAGQIKVFLDNELPDDPTVLINGGTGLYTNDAERKVNIEITSSDTHTGLKDMDITDGTNSELGIDWSPVYDEWILPDTDGNYIISVLVRDYLGNQSSTSGSASVILDRASPVITINTDNILVSAPVQIVQGADFYEISGEGAPFGVDSYYWERISGSDSINFSNTGIADPTVSATAEGTYYIQVTVTDNAGNSSSDIIPFTWDATPPGNIDIAGFSVTESTPGYTTTGQPTWSWSSVADADYYRVSFDAFSTYIDEGTTSYSPNTALSDGSHTLSVRAYDYAGNYSNTVSKSVTVDTDAPVITVNNYSYIANLADSSPTIDFDGDPDGSISGYTTIQWAKTLGPGTVTFGNENAISTTVSTSQDGDYQISLTATDAAGNATTAYLSLLRDITIPGTPGVSGTTLTPNLRPTWYWTSGGGGIGSYQYRLLNITDSTTVVDWTSTGTLSYQPGSNLVDVKFYKLEVQELDAANNWSNVGALTTEVDTSQTTPAQISIGDAYPSLRTVNTITWNLLTGSGLIASNYRYYFDGSGTWSYGGVGLDDSTPTPISRSGLSEGTHSITVEEYFNLAWQTAKSATHTITVDTIAPSAPILNGEGLITGDADRTAGRDFYPTWSWTSGGGGNGQYQYRMDGGSWASTTGTSYTPYKTDGTYLLEVQERDNAGNWSSISSHRITVDTIKPVLTSVALRDPSPYINDGDNSHTNSELVYVDIVGDISAEGARPVSIQYYDYNPSGWKDWGSNFTGSTETISTTVSSTNGTKTVYVQLIDEAGNYSGYINDTIILDTIAPAGTATINNGAAYTPSLSFKLNLNITDNLSQVTDFMVRSYDVYDEDGDGLVWEDYRTYSALMSSDMQFSITPGSKYTYTRIYDAAGNYVQIYDSITLQVPVAQYAWKGYYTSGASRIYYTPVTEDAGGNITRYYTYSTTNPNAAPNTNPADAAALTYEGYTTSTIYDYFTIPVGEIRYIFTRAYNVDTGGYGPYSATSVLAFGSNVTVVYDDDDSADIARANEIKALLEDDQNIVGHSSIYGTMPVWTVTLLPEDFISNTYGEANKIYGDPVILTPGVYFTTASTYDGKVRNIASMGRGIVAMGSSGGYFLYRVQYNWGVWGLTGTSPSYIDSGNQMTLTTAKTAKTRPASSSESIWYTPLYYSVLYPTYAEGSMGLNMFTTDEGRRGVSSSGAVPPPDGSIYAGDYSSTAHWPVVRQGRFLSFGYYDVPDVQVTGEVFFINLIARMDNF